MKKLILISILLNLGLAVAIAYFVTPRKNGPVETAAENSRATEKREAKTKRSPKKQIVSANAPGEPLNWRDVESEDYKNYIANLRAIQCPEETIHDIIIADVNKFYAERLKPLRKPVEQWKFWRNDRNWSGRSESDEFYKAQSDLEKEKRELLKELLGTDYEKEMAKQYGRDDRTKDPFMENLPQETKDQLSEISKKFSEKQSEIYRKAKGYIDEDTQAELRKIDKERRAEMAKVLSPEDLFEWELRNSQTAQNMKYNELEGLDASEDEFRAIFKAKLAAEDARSGGDDGEDKTAREERAKAQKESQDALKEALGEERYKEYQRNQDYDYRQLMRLADRGVPKENIQKVYEMKEDVQKAAREINADKTLTADQRREKLLEIKQVTEQEVTSSIGERGFKQWKRNAWWLRNIVPPQPSKSASSQ